LGQKDESCGGRYGDGWNCVDLFTDIDDALGWLKIHYCFQIRTFWFGTL
jgi:hypothetical protein